MTDEKAIEFLSTPSARRATSSTEDAGTWYFLFLSTPSARRATLGMIGGRTAAGRFQVEIILMSYYHAYVIFVPQKRYSIVKFLKFML